MLDIAKVTVEKMTLDRRPMDLAEAASVACARMLRSGVPRFEVQYQPTWVYADPDRITQIIDNLLGNAVKFTAASDSIRVSVSSEAGFAVLRIEDAGVGIAPEFLPRVFDPFLQGEQDLHRPMGGLGIGLTLVRRLTELHGGTVDAYSAGTVWEVLLSSGCRERTRRCDDRRRRDLRSPVCGRRLRNPHCRRQSGYRQALCASWNWPDAPFTRLRMAQPELNRRFAINSTSCCSISVCLVSTATK